MWREPSPAHSAGQAELIEDFGIIIADAPCQRLPFPCAGGDFESLELAQNLQRAAFITKLRAGSDVLPAQEPAHESSCRDRFNLLAQSAQREPVNPRQQTALAPLHTGACRGPWLFFGQG